MRSWFRRRRRNEASAGADTADIDPVAREARRMDERELSARPPDDQTRPHRNEGLLPGRVDADNGWDSGGGTI